MADETAVVNNSAPAETPAAAEPELTLDPEITTDSASDEQPLEGQAPEDELEDVEFDGKKGKVSKALKDGYLRQADYTRKTQEIAEKAKAADARDAQIAEQAQTFQRHALGVAKLVSLNEQLAAYEKATPEDWQRWSDTNATETQKAWLHYQALKDQRSTLAQNLHQQEQAWQLKAQSEATTRFEEGRKAIAAKVPGWNADLEAKLHTYAEGEGFTKAEWAKTSDHRAVNVLRKAYLYDQLVAKQRAATQQTAQQPVAAVPTVGSSRTPSRAPSDRDSPEVWLAKRNAELAAQKKRRA